MSDLISRQAAIDYIKTQRGRPFIGITMEEAIIMMIEEVPSAEPERLTDDDFETIRIHLNAQKEKLCNQQRWEEAEEYQRIIDRFMAFASAEPPTKLLAEIRIDKEDLEDLVAEKVEKIKEAMSGKWIPCSERPPKKPGSYICTCSDGPPYPKVTVIKFHPRTKAWELNGTRAYWKVRAWMPLPEPWKGEEDDT